MPKQNFSFSLKRQYASFIKTQFNDEAIEKINKRLAWHAKTPELTPSNMAAHFQLDMKKLSSCQLKITKKKKT